MIEAKKNKIIGSLFAFYNKRLLKRHFFKIHLSGNRKALNFESGLPSLIYANHSNWWDGLIVFYLTREVWKTDSYVMMEIEQMRKYSFFKWIGAFSVDRGSGPEAAASVNYASSLLKKPDSMLLIFPQGEMLPADTRPFKFFSGAARIIQNAAPVRIIPLALRYEFIMEQRPEVFVSVGDVMNFQEQAKDARSLTEKMREVLEKELDSLSQKITKRDLSGFETVFFGKRSKNKTVDALSVLKPEQGKD